MCNDPSLVDRFSTSPFPQASPPSLADSPHPPQIFSLRRTCSPLGFFFSFHPLEITAAARPVLMEFVFLCGVKGLSLPYFPPSLSRAFFRFPWARVTPPGFRQQYVAL